MADLRGNGFWMGVNLISNFADILNEQRLNKEKFLKEISDKSDKLFLNTLSEKKFNTYVLKKICSSNKKSYALLGDMLEDIYRFNFKKTSSVEQNNLETIGQANDYSLLANVDLEEHTFGVFNNMSKLVAKSYGEYFYNFLMIAMVHDFGKSKELCTHYKIPDTLSHCQRSSIYFKIKVNEIEKYLVDGWSLDERKILNIVERVIYKHHENKNDKKILVYEDKKEESGIENLFLDFLLEADKLQRESEIFMLKKQQV